MSVWSILLSSNICFSDPPVWCFSLQQLPHCFRSHNKQFSGIKLSTKISVRHSQLSRKHIILLSVLQHSSKNVDVASLESETSKTATDGVPEDHSVLSDYTLGSNKLVMCQ